MAATTALSLVLEAAEHASRIEIIIEQKAAKVIASAKSEAEALANAVTPEFQASIEALTAKLKSIRELHEETSSSSAETGTASASSAKATPIL